MSETAASRMDEMHEQARKLDQLLSDRQPGCFTWREMAHETVGSWMRSNWIEEGSEGCHACADIAAVGYSEKQGRLGVIVRLGWAEWCELTALTNECREPDLLSIWKETKDVLVFAGPVH